MSKEKDNPVVQQSLTTESVVKENLTSEQRAREYVLNINFSNSTGVYIENEIKGIAYQSYIDSYHSRDEELKAYREALKEIVKQVPRCNFNLSTSTSYSEANRLDELIVKAKQLLEEGEPISTLSHRLI